MPLLVYSYPALTPNTVIQSAKVNAKFSDISTLLNVTKLDDTNVQDAGLTRAAKLKAGTANYVVINGSDGKMSEEVALAPIRGGLGTSLVLTTADAGKVPVVNPAGTALELQPAPPSPASNLYNFNRFF